MDIRTEQVPHHRILTASISMTEQEILALREVASAQLLRRLVDAIYEELLPVLRESVGRALDAAAIAKHIEAEIQQAVTAALR